MRIIPQKITVSGQDYLLEERLRYQKADQIRLFQGIRIDDKKQVIVKVQSHLDNRFWKSRDAFCIFQQIRAQLLAAGVQDFLACQGGARVTEYIPGDTLQTTSEKLDGLNIKQVRDFLLAALEQLEVFRRAGVQHGDIKQDNYVGPIMTQGKRVPLTTKNMRIIDPETIRNIGIMPYGESIGTLHYMPPEILGRECESTSDLFSLALTALDLLKSRKKNISLKEIILESKDTKKLINLRANRHCIIPGAKRRLAEKLFRAFPRDEKAVKQVMNLTFQSLEYEAARRPQTLAEQLQILNDSQPAIQ